MKDLNANWRSKNDSIILEGISALRQRIISILSFRKNDLYFGEGDELDLQARLFSLKDPNDTSSILSDIEKAVNELDSEVHFKRSESSIHHIEDSYQLHLFVEYENEGSLSMKVTLWRDKMTFEENGNVILCFNCASENKSADIVS